MSFWSPMLTQLETFVLGTELQSLWENQFCGLAWHKRPELCTLYRAAAELNVTICLPFKTPSRRAHQRCQTVPLIESMNTAYEMQTFSSTWANIGTGNFSLQC